MIKETISKIVEKKNLTRQEMISSMNEIMTGQASPAQIGSFITALRIKGETTEEITGACMVMREKATKINVKGKVIDTCGTGGSGLGAFNISTAAGFVASASGLKVAKHGNKGVTSECGSADVLKALGVNIEITPDKVKECINKIGLGFLFAPLLHGAMKHAIGPRREIGIRTIFNVLGPLTNPANASCQVLGVYDGSLTEKLANVLKNVGVERAFVVHGMDGLDEVTITTKTKVSELKDKKVKSFYVEPKNFGINVAAINDIKGGSVEENVKIIKDVLKGKIGPKYDIVVLNAAFSLVVGDIVKDVKEGVKMADKTIQSGKAMEKLDRLIEFTNN